jgi:hypothetical protein
MFPPATLLIGGGERFELLASNDEEVFACLNSICGQPRGLGKNGIAFVNSSSSNHPLHPQFARRCDKSTAHQHQKRPWDLHDV